MRAKQNWHPEGHWQWQLEEQEQHREQEWSQLHDAEEQCRLNREKLKQKQAQEFFPHLIQGNWDNKEDNTWQDDMDIEYNTSIL
jgi:hypothetical protein